MNNQTLATLVTKAQQGDPNALQDLISGCYQDLYYYAYKTVKNEDIASDVTQESCLEIITTLKNLREPGAFPVWARRIVYHQCARHFRNKQEFQAEETEDGLTIFDTIPDESDGVMPEKVAEDKEFQKTMQDMLDSLPAEQRSAMLLYYYEKMSVRDIAEIQGTTEGTVKSRLNYGRKAVKAKVEDYEKKTGVRLHSIVPLPLLLYFLFKQGLLEAPKASAAAVAATVEAAAGSAAATTAAATATTTATVTTAAASIVPKAAAVLLAAAVATGAIWGGTQLLKDAQPQQEDGTVPTSHSHSFSSFWEYDDTTHWQACQCGERAQPEAHTYEGSVCSICSRQKTSEGLSYELTQTGYLVTGLGTCSDKEIIIPAAYNESPVVGIGDYAFSGGTFSSYDITSIVLPESITSIGLCAFANCSSLESIVIPNSVTTMGMYAFKDCDALKSVVLSDNLTSIPREAFYGCSALFRITLPKNLKEIGLLAFWGCSKLTNITIPDGVAVIDDGAFRFSGLESIHLPDSITTLGNEVFRECYELKAVNIPAGIAAIPFSAFSACHSLMEIVIPENITVINSGAFAECRSLVNISIPNSVTDIGSDAFSGCTSLSSITLPDSVKHLGASAFSYCHALESFTFPGNLESLDQNTLLGSEGLKRVTIPASLPYICDYMLFYCSNVTEIYYLGTTQQWMDLVKDHTGFMRSWDDGTGDYTVFCSNGTLSKSDF